MEYLLQREWGYTKGVGLKRWYIHVELGRRNRAGVARRGRSWEGCG